MLIAAAGLGSYANALSHPFVFDDSSAITDNPTIRSVGTSLFGGPFQLPTAGRPLVNVAFALNYALGGVEPWGYHAANLLLHVACGSLLFALLWRLFETQRLATYVGDTAKWTAASIATIWVVHPLNSEIVNYATQRTEAMMALALLATVYCGVRAIGSDSSRRWEVLSVCACAAGMACKESMATAPVVVLLVDATLLSGGLTRALKRRPLYYAALGCTWLVLAALLVEGPRWHSAGFGSGVSPGTYLLNQAPLIVRYLRLSFWPAGLVFDYGTAGTTTFVAVAPSFVFVALVAIATLVAWWGAPLLFLLGTWFFITLAPTSSVVPIATEVGADRRMYLPLIAVITPAAFGIRVLVQRLAPRTQRLTMTVAVAVVTVGFAALTIQRNREYATPLRLWQTSVERYPTGRAHYNLGIELNAAGRRDEAIEQYTQALPTEADAHYALAFELDKDGRHEEAIEHYRQSIALKPLDINVLRAYHQIGVAQMALGRPDEAVAAFREVLARHPGDVDALGGIAYIQLEQGRWSEAVALYSQYLQVNPSNVNARLNLGRALFKSERYADAARVFEDVVRVDPTQIAAHVNLGSSLAALGRTEEAVAALTRGAQLERDPDGRQEIVSMIQQIRADAGK